jgi:hypothetical protein
MSGNLEARDELVDKGIHTLLTLSYSSKINTVLYPQRASLPLKKNAVICNSACFRAKNITMFKFWS